MIRKGHSEIMENYYRMLGTIYQIFTTEFQGKGYGVSGHSKMRISIYTVIPILKTLFFYRPSLSLSMNAPPSSTMISIWCGDCFRLTFLSQQLKGQLLPLKFCVLMQNHIKHKGQCDPLVFFFFLVAILLFKFFLHKLMKGNTISRTCNAIV